MDTIKLRRDTIGLTAGFTITQRDTGAVILNATAGEALALQDLIDADAFEEGASELGDRMADIAADVAMGEYEIDIDAGNAATAIGLFTRFGKAVGFAKAVGVLDAEDAANCITYAASACDLEPINNSDMAGLAVPMLDILSLAEAAAAQTHPTTATLQ